jgi:hypothetical protein
MALFLKNLRNDWMARSNWRHSVGALPIYFHLGRRRSRGRAEADSREPSARSASSRRRLEFFGEQRVSLFVSEFRSGVVAIGMIRVHI